MTREGLRKLNAAVVALAFAAATMAFAMAPTPASSMWSGECGPDNYQECEEHTGGMEVCGGGCPSPSSICCAPE
jgi:Spy/CpxP family protein refolding chaperone